MPKSYKLFSPKCKILLNQGSDAHPFLVSNIVRIQLLVRRPSQLRFDAPNSLSAFYLKVTAEITSVLEHF